ncbi:aspartate racemase [Coriobacterium glomerans PW2]|uniref:Aspartate racemase n=1 Tax=Coriobacterium glomerans (strain ATCC 49209 / DSM 20642 / JCM 10262 / PW2) TaxID=700015 RepID=F2NBN0_CORGP|nr:aspartate/glutamate racemase family protein [Coriobacterium glomerans]AEB06839.1 aspartate racemase [Coriobacterium glomerans PW2]
MRKLGVIGGMGPEATAYFYEQVIRHTVATRDQDHVDMVILSCASMPDRTRSIRSGDSSELLALMRSCTGALESLGCANIAIPCNTSHYYYDQIRASTNVPIIHMVREAVRYAVFGVLPDTASIDPACAPRAPRMPPRRIGIMATDGTIMSGVYHRACRAFGVEPIEPDESRQRDVMSLIYDDVKAGRDPDMDKFDRVVRAFRADGCDRVILACTELSVISRSRAMPAYVLDAMDALVREAIVRSGARYRV